MISVAIQYFTDTRPTKRKVVWTVMPVVPRVGDTVHVPLGDVDGERDSVAMTVRSVAWSDDDPDHTSTDGTLRSPWHAEIYMDGYGPAN